MADTYELVALDDIRPLTDEYGNEYAQRDYSLKANRDYVAELAESMRSKGEPDEPITLIKEGPVYYVNTGRSRFEAMKLLGTRECHAVVKEDVTRKQAIEAIVRTDVKKRYEDAEKCRMVQQLMLFGDDEYVSREAGITVEQARQVRRGAAEAGNRAEEMTFDELALFDEFAGDGPAIARLLECEGAEKMRAAAVKIRRERGFEESRAAWRAAFGKWAITEVESAEEGREGGYNGQRFVPSAGRLDEVMEELADRDVRGRICESYSDCYGYLYFVDDAEDEDAGAAAGASRTAEFERLHALGEQMKEAMRDHVAGRIAALRAVKGPVYERACMHLADDVERVAAKEVFGGTDAEAYVNGTLPDPLWFAHAYREMVVDIDASGAAKFAAGVTALGWANDAAVQLADMARLHMRDGWRPAPEMLAYVEAIEQKTGGESDE